MATLVNKMNREVKVIIPNMREFRVFYSDNEGSVMFFKRDWAEETTEQEEHWRPSDEQMDALKELIDDANRAGWVTPGATELYEQLKKLM
jgi:hypothetical protein